MHSSAARAVVRRDPSVNPSAPAPFPVEPPPPIPLKIRDPHVLLRSARARLDDEARWLHGDADHEAVDANGHGCPAWSDAAVCWDVYGALRAAKGTQQGTDEALLLFARCAGQGASFLAAMDWHDAPGRTHAEVLSALDAAIEASAPARAT